MTKQEPEFGLRAAPYRRMSFLSKKYVPQGLAVLPELSLLIAAYMEDGGSCLFHIDRDGRTSALSLMESELEPHLGHVGGLALGSSELWIASSGQLLRFSFETTSLPDTDTLIATHVLDLPHKASIATYFDGYVYVGEFAKTTDEPQPMLYKYSETELRSGVTEAVASYPLPIQAQGVAISATGIYVVRLVWIQAEQGLLCRRSRILKACRNPRAHACRRRRAYSFARGGIVDGGFRVGST